MTPGIAQSGTPLAFTRARRLRKLQTSTEKILWDVLRGRRFHGMKFRRQVPIGIYIVDFLCADARLVIEVDGESHSREGAKEYDEDREAYLIARQLFVIRFSNAEVKTNLQAVLARLYEVVTLSTSP